ncbi:MAG: hypothetical protein ACLPZR_20495 [Solirubrobacteraceae bacterium]
MILSFELGARAARGAVLVIAFWPAAYFFSAPYSESLFLAISAGTFLAARQARWLLAGLLGAAAAATRNTGILLVLPLLAMYLYGPRSARVLAAAPVMTGRWRPRFRLQRDALWLGLVPLGLIAYCVYLQFELGNWQAWRSAQTRFGRPGIASPITTVHLALSGAYDALQHGLLEGR